MIDSLEKHYPEVSIIIPTFNRAHLIAESLESIIYQTFENWECIIVDDHSIDNTAEVIRKYLHKDGRFKYYRRPPNKTKGANSCRNFGLENASGKYIHWFDSDDVAHPHYLQISLDLIKKHGVDFCRFTRHTFKGKFHYNFEKNADEPQIEFIDQLHIEKLLKNELSFNTCNVVWEKLSLGNLKFNEEIVYGDEWEFYPRLLSNGLKGISISNVLFFGRKHEESTTSEFWRNDPVRRASKIKAVKLVIETLESKNLLSPSLITYFIQYGFFIKDFSIINHILIKSNAGFFKTIKYKFGYKFYPLIRPVIKFKGKIKNLYFELFL